MALKETFEPLQENGLTLKKNKSEFAKPAVKYFGLIFSDQGVHPDPDKTVVLNTSRTPKE